MFDSEGLLRLLRARHLGLAAIRTCTTNNQMVSQTLTPTIPNELVSVIDIHAFEFRMLVNQPEETRYLLTYRFKVIVVLGQPRMATMEPILEEVKNSFHTGDIADAKVIAYSRRTGYGKASLPKSFFVRASVLREAGFKMDVCMLSLCYSIKCTRTHDTTSV